MKLSEVTLAHDLVGQRRTLVKAFVEIGSQPIWWGRNKYASGFAVDDPMEVALRAAARAEVRRRIEEADARLGKLGVEVDGIEIAIASEEERVAKEEAAKNEDAARAEALAEAKAASAEKAA